MTQFFIVSIQFLAVILIAPFVVGLVRMLKARLQGRKGASPFLPYYSFATMFKKEMVIPKSGSLIFHISPFIVLASAFGLAMVVPTLFLGSILAPMSDFMIVAGLLMLGSIFLVLGGIDPGSAFGGMGSSREMTLAAILEPTVIVVFAAYAFVSGSFLIDGMLAKPFILSNPFLVLSLIAFVMLALAENARYPVDNPATHLELTMVHEAMILEYSGPYLAMLEYASAIKLTVFSLLLSNFILPSSMVISGAGALGVIFGLLFFIAKAVIIAALLAFLETSMAKMRFYRMSEYAAVSFFAAFFGLAAAVLAKTSLGSANYLTFFALLTVLFTVFLFGNLRIRTVLKFYVLSSISIAGVAVSMGLADVEDAKHLFFFAAGTIVVKAIIIPWFVSYAVRHFKKINQFQAYLRPASSYFLAAMILVIAFFVTNKISLIVGGGLMVVIYIAITLVLFGIAKMLIMHNIFSQIVGILVLENGLALFTLATVKTLPLVIELGIFAVTVVSVFILSKLSINIKELYGSTDTEELRNLID